MSRRLAAGKQEFVAQCEVLLEVYTKHQVMSCNEMASAAQSAVAAVAAASVGLANYVPLGPDPQTPKPRQVSCPIASVNHSLQRLFTYLIHRHGWQRHQQQQCRVSICGHHVTAVYYGCTKDVLLLERRDIVDFQPSSCVRPDDLLSVILLAPKPKAPRLKLQTAIMSFH